MIKISFQSVYLTDRSGFGLYVKKLAEIAMVMCLQLDDEPNAVLIKDCAMLQAPCLYNVMNLLQSWIVYLNDGIAEVALAREVGELMYDILTTRRVIID